MAGPFGLFPIDLRKERLLPKRIHNLDGFRFVAALTVLLGHLAHFRFKYGIWTPGQNVLNTASQVAVSFFFVLSGFLITYLLLQYRDKTPEVKLSSRLTVFYRRRMLRIWPLYYLLFLVCFFVLDRGFLASVLPPGSPSPLQKHPTELAVGYGLFMPNYTGHHYGGLYFLGPTWSLAVEEFFYLFFPIGFFLTGKKHTGIYLGILALVSLSLFMASRQIGSALFDEPRDASLLSVYLYRYRIFCFAFGGLIAWSQRPESGMQAMNKAFSPAYFSWGSGLLLCGFLVINRDFGHYMHLVYTGLITFFLYAVTCSGIRFRLLNLRPLVYLGKISYGIYLLHPLAITIVFYCLRPLELPLQSVSFTLLFFGGTILLTIALSVISFEYFEKFFLRFREKIRPAA